MWTRDLSVGLALGLIVVAAGFGAFGASSVVGELRTTAAPSASSEVPVVAAADSPLNAVLSVNRSSLDMPGSFTVDTTASGGNPSPSYIYHYYGMPAGCTVNENPTWSCTPSATGTFDINVSVSDQNGNVTSSNFEDVTVDSAVTATLVVNVTSVSENQPISVTTTPGGGSGSYNYDYFGTPPGCGGFNSASFTCNPSSTGQYTIYVEVMDTNGGVASSNSVGLSVTSSGNGNVNGNGNGNGNGGGNSGNNSSNPLSGLLSGFSGVLSLLLIAGIIGFVTWILLIVGVWIIAVVLIRRLPKRGASVAAAPATSAKCASCSANVPGGSKFCPECGASTAPKNS